MTKVSKISGFPEWLPGQKLVEDRVIGKIKAIYESHGFTPIETPAVELLSTLVAKGVADKELYGLRRAAAGEEDESELGLHFDLTVPFARYTAQHLNDLVFPFKRYQLQKVWRGDRPQKGRFREFYQFDIDVVARDNLPLACDAEVVTVVDKAFRAIGIGKHVILLNNRKILLGMYRSLGLDEESRKKAITVIDKIEKIGARSVTEELTKTVGLSADVARRIVEWCGIRVRPAEFGEKLSNLGVEDELFQEGVKELSRIIELVTPDARENIEVSLSLARGLDYYTGIIIETHLVDYPAYGSVCGGGRYDDLVSQFINQTLPGVGVSIGLTRLMDLIFQNELLPIESATPTRVLVSVYSEDQRVQCNALAERFRAAGVATEVFITSVKLGKQIEYASKRSIQYVCFLQSETGEIEIKDINDGKQVKVTSVEGWCQDTFGQ